MFGFNSKEAEALVRAVDESTAAENEPTVAARFLFKEEVFDQIKNHENWYYDLASWLMEF